MSTAVTHVVQAYDNLLGWMDCRAAKNITDAHAEAERLRTDPESWMQGRIGKVRVVPVMQSNCKGKYNPT